uniref:Uncharacterized protein n=1 Tax=Romanomermis culicivorax TaxID=13658 RepID=A0A915HRF3_ROMCU
MNEFGDSKRAIENGNEGKFEESVITFSIARLESPNWEFAYLRIRSTGIPHMRIAQLGIHSLTWEFARWINGRLVAEGINPVLTFASVVNFFFCYDV